MAVLITLDLLETTSSISLCNLSSPFIFSLSSLSLSPSLLFLVVKGACSPLAPPPAYAPGARFSSLGAG